MRNRVNRLLKKKKGKGKGKKILRNCHFEGWHNKNVVNIFFGLF